MRYIDTANRRLGDTIYAWLKQALAGAKRLAIQTGYFRFDALEAFRPEVEALLRQGGELDLVIGINEDRILAGDLEALLALLAPWLGTTAHVYLVGASDGLFHPKCYVVETSAGKLVALIGSANLTIPGIGHNIEAGIALGERGTERAAAEAALAAVVRWRSVTPPLARSLSMGAIAELSASRDIEPSVLALQRRRERAQRARSARNAFPSLKKITGVPERSRPRLPKVAVPVARLGQAPAALPSNVVGIVKRLSSTDVKGFQGRVGTPYIALPAVLAQYLPMRAAGTNSEPRLDTSLEARLSGAISEVVFSGHDTTNVTHVGRGARKASHSDLRLNILQTLIRGLLYVASNASAPVPAEGDAVAVEFFDGGRLLRLTFATDEPLRRNLLALATEGRGRWGWLPQRQVPQW